MGPALMGERFGVSCVSYSATVGRAGVPVGVNVKLNCVASAMSGGISTDTIRLF
jgi:hypothetical protein